jgi:hypothetical protein
LRCALIVDVQAASHVSVVVTADGTGFSFV